MSLKDDILSAMKEYENERPRSQQIHLGPSELGGCREYIRNVMVGTPSQDNDEWPTAAVVGTVVGAYMENVCSEKMDALTEVPVTATLPSGLQVSGHADIVLVDRNAVVDCKTKDGLDDVLRNGASMENLVQVSIYALALVQAGVLSEGCTAHLVYVDRAGNQQFLHEVELTWDQILIYIEKCEERLGDVIEAQDRIDQGETDAARHLRDKTPPFCYSHKVMCPFRDACWKGSEWVPNAEIIDDETIETVARFVAAREMVKQGESIKKANREKLRGLNGITPDGHAVTWAGSEDRPMLYVTRVKESTK